ncbi:hypothetical protein ACG2F4_15700 [Halalkalibaculum sp. DA3122]|uniref:hypothetical protein n=1 Tax=unclassified Halalkalibaculum TaxID=2964617 RepID=UPI00375481E0
MSEYLKTLSADQLEHLIKEKIDDYLGGNFTCTVKDLNTPNVNTEGDKITFVVELRDQENTGSHH